MLGCEISQYIGGVFFASNRGKSSTDRPPPQLLNAIRAGVSMFRAITSSLFCSCSITGFVQFEFIYHLQQIKQQ